MLPEQSFSMVAEKGFGPALVSGHKVLRSLSEILLSGFVVVHIMLDFRL